MKTPLGRYYDWAHGPERIGALRFWLLLPSLLLFLAAVLVAPALSRSAAALLGLSIAWIAYVVVRSVIDLVRLARRFVALVGPDWRQGWRAAWRTIRGGGR